MFDSSKEPRKSGRCPGDKDEVSAVGFDQQAYINQLVNEKLIDILTQNIPDIGEQQMIREFFKVFTAHGITIDEAFTITYELTLILQKHTRGKEDKNV